jgi:predicted ATPase
VAVTLHLKPEVEAGLLARAHASGMDLEQYLLSLAEQAALQAPSAAAATPAREEAVRRMLEFGEKYHLTLSEPITRALLHEGHRY